MLTMSAESDDARLVAAARSGNPDAFETLVRRHGGKVYRVALRLVGDPTDAEDATQDTFVQAWRHLERFRGDSAFSTWLYRIVVNRCLRLLRDRPSTAPLVELPAPAIADPQRAVEVGSQLEAVSRAVLALPFQRRAPLVLRELEGCTYEEIADALEISLPAVKGRLHRARRELLIALRGWT